MGKKKRRKPKSRKRAAVVAARPVEIPDGPSTNSPDQRCYDMPYSAAAPRMINPDLGLHHLVARVGHNAAYEIAVTLLDAPDHRLIRSGVLLAHRVLDGRGEWYLGAPDWVPLLPKELIIPMGQGELPDELAELVRPFRRGAPLSPVAALRCERREFALRNGDGQTVALLRDDKVTVRRNGRIMSASSSGRSAWPISSMWSCGSSGSQSGAVIYHSPRPSSTRWARSTPERISR